MTKKLRARAPRPQHELRRLRPPLQLLGRRPPFLSPLSWLVVYCCTC